MAMDFTGIPGPAKITSKGISVSIAAGEDISTDVYRAYVDVPCNIHIEPMPTPAGDAEVDMLEDDVFEVD